MLLLWRHRRIVLRHLQDVVDDVLLVHGAGQRDGTRLGKELRLSVLESVQDVIQL